MQGHGEPGQLSRAVTEGAVTDPFGEPVRDEPGQHLRRGVAAGERGLVVEVAVVEICEHAVQLRGGPPDVDHDAVGVHRPPGEGRVHDVRRSVQALRRPEHLAPEAVGDHQRQKTVRPRSSGGPCSTTPTLR